MNIAQAFGVSERVIGLTLALFVTSFGFRGPGRISRIEGGMLVAAYGAYMVMLYFSAIS